MDASPYILWKYNDFLHFCKKRNIDKEAALIAAVKFSHKVRQYPFLSRLKGNNKFKEILKLS